MFCWTVFLKTNSVSSFGNERIVQHRIFPLKSQNQCYFGLVCIKGGFRNKILVAKNSPKEFLWMLHEYILLLKVSLKPQHMRIYKMRRHSTTEFLISWSTFSCSKPTIETLEKGAFTRKRCFYCYLWTCFTPFYSVSVIDVEQVNVSWK